MLSDTKQSVVSRKQTDFEFLNMSIKTSKQMKKNILKEIFKHESELKQ